MTGDLSLTDRIRIEARRLGFAAAGVAPSGPLPWRQAFDSWLSAGMQGEMAYLARQADKRRNPSLILEDVRSILVFAMNYFSPAENQDNPCRGRISRYAWGDDYHRLMEGRLRALLSFILQEEPQARGLYYVDTGPIMEKSWGAQTTLGWMGKHSNLISRKHGSWFVLGVILLTCELAYDAPERDHCGSCTRCITACPTGAIIAPYVVDARLCISYLTIELKGVIPRHLRPLIGNRIFGCDDCQEVCPWNRFAVAAPEPAFKPRDGNPASDLIQWAAINTAEFKERFRNSPVRRAGRDGFVRNVLVVLGNTHLAEAIPALVRALSDSSALVRGHAAWALGEIPFPEAGAALTNAGRFDADPWVLEEIELAIEHWNHACKTRVPADTPDQSRRV